MLTTVNVSSHEFFVCLFLFLSIGSASHCACGDGCAVVDRCSNSVFLSQTWPVSLVLLTSVHLKKPACTNDFNFVNDVFFSQRLKFNDIHLLQLGQFMYSCKNSFLPPGFNNNFSQNNQFHSYNTRNSHAYRLPYCHTNIKKFSVFFQGPKFFNSLDNEVVNSKSISSFKKLLKNKLISSYQ